MMNKRDIKRCFCSKAGFTLIELLVVVLIIGILAAVALPQYNKAVKKARATEAITLLKAFVIAEDAYYLTHGEYTNNLNELDIQIPSSLQNASVGGLHYGNLDENDNYENQFTVGIKGEDNGFSYYFETKQLACVVYNSLDEEKAHSYCKMFSQEGPSECHSIDKDDGSLCYYL